MSTTNEEQEKHSDPTEEDLGFRYDVDPEEVDVDSVEMELASSFALWFYERVHGWHPEEIAMAAIRFGIASGELMVVKEVEFDGRTDRCSGCGFRDPSYHGADFNFCPGCGAKIIKG